MSSLIQIAEMQAALRDADEVKHLLGESVQVSQALMEKYEQRVRSLQETQQESPVKAAMALV